MEIIMSNKALFVIDVQKDFLTGALANPRAVKKLPNIVKKIKEHDGIVIATHDTHFNELQVKTNWPLESNAVVYEESLEGQKLPVPHCIKLSEGWEIEPTVLAALQEKNKDGQKKFYAVDKYTFGYKKWEEYLKFFEFDEIEICGFVSSICVLANAIILRAIYPNKRIVVDVNCIEDLDDEGQAAAIKCLKMQQIDVIGE
jgi:nicotinamidase-related amidase